MIYISIAVVLATLIGSVAYVWPKVAFLALQGQVLTQQQAKESELTDLFAEMNKTGVEDSGTYI